MAETTNDEVEEDVTLFKSASNNSYFPVYFNALPEPGVDALESEKLTPGGMGEIDGFGGFARNVAAAAPDLKVIIWDRRNIIRSQIKRDPGRPVPRRHDLDGGGCEDAALGRLHRTQRPQGRDELLRQDIAESLGRR